MTAQEKWHQYRHEVPYHDMSDYMDFLREVAVGNVFEIGVRDGVSTAALLMGVHSRGVGHVYSVDINPNCAHALSDPAWSFIHGHSQEIIKPEFQLDVLLIDGDHSYRSVMMDYLRFSPLVKRGGLILMHDVEPSAMYRERIVTEKWFPLDECELAWSHICDLHDNCKVIPGMTGLGVIHVQ